jgi:hypothetical protein
MDDRGIEDRPLLQQGALILERLLDRLENLVADSVLLEQMTKFRIVVSSASRRPGSRGFSQC